MAFKDRLRDLRNKRGLTQEEFGKVFNVIKQTVSSWEKGNSKPDLDLASSMADFFGVSTDDLLDRPADTMPVSGKGRKLSIIGTVKSVSDGLSYMDQQGEEWADAEDIPNGAIYYWLQIKGDSMIGEGIMPGDLALVREQPEVEYGQLGIAIIDGEEGTLKRIYKKDDSIVLQSANAKYPPRIFAGAEINTVKIVGKVKVTKRKY